MLKFYPFLLLFFHGIVFSQNSESAEIEYILKKKPQEIPKYSPKAKQGVVLFQTGFNDAVFENQSELARLGDNVITKVELVYTTYHKSETFDQYGLNRKRLQAFFKLVPNAVSQPGIEWVLKAQTGCTSSEEGKTFFHGVVVYYRHEADEKLKDAEVAFIKEVAAGRVAPGAYDVFVKSELKAAEEKDTTIAENTEMAQFRGGENARNRYFSTELKKPFGGDVAGGKTLNVEFILDRNGKPKNISYPDERHPSMFTDELTEFIKDMPDWLPSKEDGKPVESIVTFSVTYPEKGSPVASDIKIAVSEKRSPAGAKPDFKNIRPSPESVNVMTALKLVDPAESGLVCDVTGSMALYNAQVVAFLTEHFTKKERVFLYVAFFNDGDNRIDKKKKIGATGGIYTCKPTSLDVVMEQLAAAMSAGNGGDLPENNLEAVLKLQQDAPECKRVTMIADNYATPRDLSLVSAVTVPLDVILCGSGPSNEAYLDIVAATKGTLMFGGRTYRNLDAVTEGGRFSVGKYTYVLVKGKFRLLEE